MWCDVLLFRRENQGMQCAAADCSFIFVTEPQSHRAGGNRPRSNKTYVQAGFQIILKAGKGVHDYICYRCAMKDVRMRKAAASSDSAAAAREVARITTARRSLSLSSSKPPAASTRRAQKSVDKLQTLTAAAVNTPFISPTRIVRLTPDDKMLPDPSQLVVMPLIHYVTLARMLTCGQVRGNDCPGQLKLLEEPRIITSGPSLKLQCTERGCGSIHMLPDDLVEAEARGSTADHALARRTYTAVLHAGMGYAAYQSFMVGLGAKPISDKAFFGAQTQVEPVVEQMSEDIMKANRNGVREAFEKQQKRTDLAVDGSWSTKREAHHGAVTIMWRPSIESGASLPQRRCFTQVHGVCGPTTHTCITTMGRSPSSSFRRDSDCQSPHIKPPSSTACSKPTRRSAHIT
jgi:hypothetical protein